MQLLLIAIVITTAGLFVWRHQRISALTLGAVGLLAYSVPALLGLSLLPSVPGTVSTLHAASPMGVLAMVVVWAGFAAAVGLRVLRQSQDTPDFLGNRQPHGYFLISAGALSGLLLAFFMARQGPLFFTGDRETVAQLGVLFLIWKWIVGLGLVAAIVGRSWAWAACFSLLLILAALAGDRTTIVIVVMACLLVSFSGLTLSKAFRSWIAWASVLAMLAIIGLTKPIYKLVKGVSFQEAFVEERPLSFLLQWEAFGTHEILERVLNSGFHFPFWTMATGTIGQLLIVPSAFGIESSQFNLAITSQLFPDITFGIAYSLWAQWFAMLSWPGLLIGGFLYGLVLISLENATTRLAGHWRPFLLIISALVAVYAHRNSIENELALARQIFLAFLPILVVSIALSKIRHAPAEH